MKTKRKFLFGSTMFTALVVGLISAMMLLSNTPLLPQGWNTIVTGANVDPASGESAVINVFIYPHQATVSVYDNNCSEGTAYAHFDASPGLNESLEGDVPYNTRFDIVVACRYNYSHAYNNSQWDVNAIRGLITCADLSISADTVMNESAFYNDTGSTSSDWAYVNFYVQDASYTIDRGETVNVTSFKMQYYG